MQTVINVEVPLIISYLSASLYTFILKGFHKFADVQKKKIVVNLQRPWCLLNEFFYFCTPQVCLDFVLKN